MPVLMLHLFSATAVRMGATSSGPCVTPLRAGAECLKAGPLSKSPIGGLNIIDPPKDELALD
jgi:hypothetical protein